MEKKVINVLFFNDTRVETNPGCHATVTALSRFITKQIPTSKITYKPLGEEYDVFSQNLYKESSILLRIKYLSKVLLKLGVLKSKKVINSKAWEEIALNNLSVSTKNSIEKSDLIIINMEGTIHHNSTSGLALLGIAFYSKYKNKKVALVNGSYQDVDFQITKKALKDIDFISAREVMSHAYLRKQNIKVSLIPDFAFKANINFDVIPDRFDYLKKKNKKCLYTVGVLGIYSNQKNGISFTIIKKHLEEIKNQGYTPYYLKIEEKESEIASQLGLLGVKTISYEDGIDFNNIGSLISNFDLLITGRYHIGIFGLMNYVPTFFLKSNTYKIEGLLKMLELEELMILNNDIANKNMLDVKKDYKLPNEKVFMPFKDFLIKFNK